MFCLEKEEIMEYLYIALSVLILERSSNCEPINIQRPIF